VVVRLFGKVSDVGIDWSAEVGDLSHDFHAARCRLQQSEEAVHSGRFASSVLPDQGKEVALADLERHSLQGVDRPTAQAPLEGYADIMGADHISPVQNRLLRPLMMASSD
jgi:hypothetical protein